MIYIFMLTMLFIYLPYVGAKIGASCQGDSDCVMNSEACSSQGLCQCKEGYRIHIYPSSCNSDSAHSEPCRNISECMVCNATIGIGTCTCNRYFYEYQRSCYLKGVYKDTCYTAEGCRDTMNLVCSNSSGGICMCRTGYYWNNYNRCTEKGDHNDTCYNADGCRDTGNLVCSNSSGGICVCRTGYFWHHYGKCAEKVPVGHGCYMPDACRDEHARCTSLNNGPPGCKCMEAFYAHQGSCILMLDAPKNLIVMNVTATAFTIWLEKPNEVFGELLGYVLTIKLADTGRCVIEHLIRCESGCVNIFPNQTTLFTTCALIIQYVSKQDLVMMKRNINTLNPGAVYWVSVAAVSQYGKGFTADINVTTLHEGDFNVGSHLESNSITTIIIASIACGTLMVIALMAAGTVIIIKRKRASKRKSEADAGSTYMDLPCKTNEDQYDTLAVTSAY